MLKFLKKQGLSYHNFKVCTILIHEISLNEEDLKSCQFWYPKNQHYSFKLILWFKMVYTLYWYGIGDFPGFFLIEFQSF